VLGIVLCVLGGALCRPPSPAHAQDSHTLEDRIGKQQKELDKIRKEIEEHRAQSKKLRQKERAAIKKLSSLDKEIDLSRQLLKKLEQQEALITERIDSLRIQINYEDVALAAQETVLAKRLRQLYKRDPNYEWDIILGSENLHQALRRYKFSRIIAEHDAELIAGIRDRKLEYEVESAELTAALADISVVRNSREEETKKLERSKKQRQTTLAQIRNEKTQHTEAIKELEKAQEEVKDLIGNLETRRLDLEREGIVTEGDFVKLKGKMIRPVDGKIVRRFGRQKHPKYGTVTFNNGVDIGAAPGTPIRAVAGGRVEFVDWIDGYGKCIILNHGGGYYTLYAHVSATFVTQNRAVAGGDVIAEVGDTGSIDGYECHFEIRKSKQALDPLEWFGR
jgi:septal ring factor EnvC (AmiA/AmiB activator)